MAQESSPTLESFHYWGWGSGGAGRGGTKTRAMCPIPTTMDAADLAGFKRRDVVL